MNSWFIFTYYFCQPINLGSNLIQLKLPSCFRGKNPLSGFYTRLYKNPITLTIWTKSDFSIFFCIWRFLNLELSYIISFFPSRYFFFSLSRYFTEKPSTMAQFNIMPKPIKSGWLLISASISWSIFVEEYL